MGDPSKSASKTAKAIKSGKAIKTKNLVLRPTDLADAPRIAHFSSEPEIARNVSSIPCPNPVAAVEGWLLIMEARRQNGTAWSYAIEAPGEGLVGCLGAGGPAGAAPELGYWVAKPYWGRGLATEAVSGLIAHLLEHGIEIIQSGHFIDNPASRRVLDKNGFIETGEIARTFSLGRGVDVLTQRMVMRAA